MMKAKGRPKHFCRDQALEAAITVFSSKGYEAASVAILGEAMNMNPPSLYNAFGDKEGLFVEVLERYQLPVIAAMKAIFEDEADTYSAIEKLFALLKEKTACKNSLGCLIVNSGIHAGTGDTRISKKIKQLHDEKEQLIYQRLKLGQLKGDISGDANIRGLARYINGLLQGAGVLARGQQSPKAVKDLLEHGLRGFRLMMR